jgi:hypothetical protein
VVKSVRVGDISELHESSSFDISVFQDMMFFVCVGVMYSGEYDVCDVTLSVHLHRAS